jgi:hypothetical protein
MRVHCDEKTDEDDDVDPQFYFCLAARFCFVLSHTLSFEILRILAKEKNVWWEKYAEIVKKLRAPGKTDLRNFHTIFTSLLYTTVLHFDHLKKGNQP